MIVQEIPYSPDGELIYPPCKRKYTVSDMEFSYTAPACKILTFEDAIATSGSWEHGLAGVVKDNKFYHQGFTKDANNFRVKSPFWNNARDEFDIDLSVAFIHHDEEEIFSWFNIGQYWHWFLEDLPLVKAFRTKPDIPIYTNHLNQFQLDSLHFFPDILERIIEVDTPATIKANKVHVATYPAISYRGKSARWAVEFLRDEIKTKETIDQKRIYISRNDAIARNVKNESEVLNVLVNEYDFVPINTVRENSMSRMPLSEKLKLFASADIVVSPTGAGLTHTHAMKPGSTVIDFNHDFEVTEECGWNNIGDVCGLNWYTTTAKTLDMPEERPKKKNSHMSIDVNSLRDILDNAISKAS